MLKLDFQKAYDILDWKCLKDVLRHIAFDQRWLSWVDLWLALTKLQILLNGMSGKEIACKRRRRQGGPLSPLMFVLAVEGLNKIFERTRAVGWTKGLPRCNNVSVTNVQYADDTLLFGMVT